jgi:hypothetical protein
MSTGKLSPDPPLRHHFPAGDGISQAQAALPSRPSGQAIAPPYGVFVHFFFSLFEFIMSLSKERIAI